MFTFCSISYTLTNLGVHMADQSKIEELGIKAFQRRKVLTIMELTSLLGLSDRSIHRRLKKWKALTSYNHNGRYYTLPSTPCFDENGIWHFHDISFSSQGTLKKTVVSIVTNSLKGLSANEIGNMLNMNPQSFLSPFQNDPNIFREKISGRYIWFAATPQILQKQQSERIECEQKEHINLISDRDAVMILVDMLHHPMTKVQDIQHRIIGKGVHLSDKAIIDFLVHHDLQKKTMDRNFFNA
jgi:hypothetical protein